MYRKDVILCCVENSSGSESSEVIDATLLGHESQFNGILSVTTDV